MRLYRLTIRGRVCYAGTQADARAMKRETGATWIEIEVLTDKAGLLAFLNENAPGPPAPIASVPASAAQAPSRTPATPLALNAESILARMDNPDLSIDGIIETIARMKGGYALKRVAGAVASRFEELSR